MKQAALVLGLLAATLCWGQWVSRSFWLPDSFPYLDRPNAAFLNPATSRLYLLGCYGDLVHVVDAVEGRKFGTIDTALCCGAVHCPEQNRVWLLAWQQRLLLGLDDRADTVVTSVRTGVRLPHGIACSPTSGKLYVSEYNHDRLVVFDAGSGAVLDTIAGVREVADRFAWDSVRDRLYCSGMGWDDEDPVAVVDCRLDSLVAGIPGTGGATDLVLDPDCTRLYCLCWDRQLDRNLVRIVDTELLAVVDSVVIPLGGDWGYAGRLMPMFQHERLYAGFVDSDLLEREPCCNPQNDTLALLDITGDSLLRLVGKPEGHITSGFAVNEAEGKLYLSSWGGDSLMVFDVDGEIQARVRTSGRSNAAAWIPATDEVFVVCTRDTVLAIDAAGDSVVGRIDYYGTPALWMGWSPARRGIYLANRIGIGRLGDRDTLEYWLPRMFDSPRYGLAYSRELDRFYFGSKVDGSYRLLAYDCARDSVVAEVELAECPVHALLLPEHDKLYIYTTADVPVAVYDIRQDRVLGYRDWGCERFVRNPRTGLVYAFDEGRLYVSVVDPAVDTVVDRILARFVRGITVSESDNELWLNEGDSLRVVDGQTHEFLAAIPNPVQTGGYFVWAEPGNKLYIVAGSSLHIVDCSSRRVEASIDLGFRADQGVFHNPRNDKLFVMSRGTVGVIDCRRQRLKTVFYGIWASSMAWDSLANELYLGHHKHVVVLKDVIIAVEEESHAPVWLQAASVVRRLVVLPPERRAALFSITGRRVMDLLPGENDIRQVAPGIYFIREVGTSRSTKVIVQR